MGLRILFLEDNLAFSDTVQQLLELRGHDVVHTESVLDAIEIFSTRKFDAVITDLHLKGEEEEAGSGFGFIKEIRNKLKSDVVIAMTTGLELIDPRDAKKRGADIFYHKPLPVSYDAFISEIEAFVEARRNGREDRGR